MFGMEESIDNPHVKIEWFNISGPYITLTTRKRKRKDEIQLAMLSSLVFVHKASLGLYLDRIRLITTFQSDVKNYILQRNLCKMRSTSMGFSILFTDFVQGVEMKIINKKLEPRKRFLLPNPNC